MIIWNLAEPIGSTVELPWQVTPADWAGLPLTPAPRHLLVQDPDCLWWLAAHERPANPHPDAGPGDFQEGLWRHDVAELFIAAPDGQAYLEFNVSPLGAWWAAAFGQPRQPKAWITGPPRLQTTATATDPGGWQTRVGIPLIWLRQEIGWGDACRANHTFILESPLQRFASASPLPGATPDFHQPDHFRPVETRVPH